MGTEQTFCPVLPLIGAWEIAWLARQERISAEEAFVRLFEARERAIAAMADDPTYQGWNSPIAEVVWGLLGAPWMDPQFCVDMRKCLGFDRPVRSLLILGGNRSGKTLFGARTMMKMLLAIRKARTWMFHTNHQQSVEYHHALMWQHLPKAWRRKVKSMVEYISWNQQMGFSSDKFVIQDGGENSFRNYSQDRTAAVEGGEPDAVFADETIAADWVETLEMRLANRNGVMLVGFTPIDGYTATVRMFCDGARTVKSCTAFLLPRDGKPALPHLALGLTEDEFVEVERANQEQRPPKVLPCRPQECRRWMEGESAEPAVPAGRTFETLPRVLKCAKADHAVVYFYSSDNPFGNPLEVINKVGGKSSAFVRERFYGLADKLVAARFMTFDERVHLVKAASIPQMGTNHLIVDPCSGRAMFMLWIRATPDGKHYVYREWPGNYHIPRVGVPEPWAEASTGKELDGRKGKGQRSPGWGMAGYKREIARLEGWREKRTSTDEYWQMECPEGKSEEEWVRSWTDEFARERVYARYMDARFANTKSFEEGGMVTLIEKFREDMGLEFLDSSTGGGRWTISDGCEMVESALAWDANRPMDFFNEPKLFVSEECTNVTFALKTWTGEDGQEGATKDPIDCLRMYFLKGGRYEGEGWLTGANVVEGAGCY